MIAMFFDTETTGFVQEDFTPEIVQIAAIVQDTETMEVLHELSLIVTPSDVIPDSVAGVHGITTEVARTVGLKQIDAHSIFIRLLERCELIVAHNITFDMEMLELNWQDAWFKATELLAYDTMMESRMIMDLPPGTYHGDYTEGPKPPKLQEAYKYFAGRELQNAHDAMADVRACRDIYFGIQAVRSSEHA